MTRKFARILLVTLVAFALGGLVACGDSGPAQKAEQAVDEMGEAASDMGEAAMEMVDPEEEETQ
jgi:hypothetical protein